MGEETHASTGALSECNSRVETSLGRVEQEEETRRWN